MAWDDEITAIVRALLQDQDTEVEYEDDEIAQMIAVSAFTTALSRQFVNTYRVRVEDDGGSISPDPTNTATRDDAFIMIVAYKTIINFIKAEIRTGLSQVIRIKDGDSELGFSRDPATINALLKSFEDDLNDLLYRYDRGQFTGISIVSSHRFNFECPTWPNS